MAPKSLFPRIVLVKSLADGCVPSLRECVGKFTHIQSFNGILLDGLSITDATTIFQSAVNMTSVQLVVRYVHPIKSQHSFTPGLISGTPTMRTPISPIPEKRVAEKIDPRTETLPVPLVILGDIPVLCRELFKQLSGTVGDSTSLLSDEMDSQVSARSGSNVEQSTLVASGNATMTTLHIPSIQPARADSSVSSLDGSDTDSHFQSDKYIRRLSGSRSLFNCGLSSPSSTGHMPTLNRQNSTVDTRFILNMFTRVMDRKFVHLFLRQSSIYLVVVSLEDVVADPTIHFENLLYWLRLVQTYVSPTIIRRVMIVGMSDGPMSKEELECLANLEGAIKEAKFPHVFFKDETSSVISFDMKNPKVSVERLCSAIGGCMDAVMQRSFHMANSFYNHVFQPFAGLTNVLLYINRSREVVMSRDKLLSIYNCYDDNYFNTLAAYSSALVDDRCKFEGRGGKREGEGPASSLYLPPPSLL
jgi:hypothetical protein